MAGKSVVTEKTFNDLGLCSYLVKQCLELGLQHPTPVQYHCIPKIIAGEDCISSSQTGTGKTLAFALPILQKWLEDPYGIFALILTPTRELAYQISQQFEVLGKSIRLEVLLLVGGMDMMFQGKKLSSHPHIIVSTPGRLVDHINSCDEFSLKKIRFLVLDEADRLMEGNFTEQLPVIIQALGKRAGMQTLMFSATMTKTLEQLKGIASSKPFIWSSEEQNTTVEKLDQKYIFTPPALKNASMLHVIQKFQEKHPESLIIVFTKTCKNCQLLSIALKNLGFKNMSLNSMLSQKDRLSSLTQFKSGAVKLLVCTDVASRGLDIPIVDLVINHNVPLPVDYIHRVGRTARAGRCGSAVTIACTRNDLIGIHAIEKEIKKKLTEQVTSEKHIFSILIQVNTAVREAEIILDENDFGEKKSIYKRKRKILGGASSSDDDSLGNSHKKKKHRKKRKKVLTH